SRRAVSPSIWLDVSLSEPLRSTISFCSSAEIVNACMRPSTRPNTSTDAQTKSPVKSAVINVVTHRTRRFRRLYLTGITTTPGGATGLGVQQPPTGHWDRAPQLPCRLNPLADHHLDVRHRFLVRRPIGRAAGQLRNLGDERLVLLAPVQDD